MMYPRLVLLRDLLADRTIKDATIKAFHYDFLASLNAHVVAFVAAYNFAKHLKALRWRTPFEAICDAWTKDPWPFNINLHDLIAGPNTYRRLPNWVTDSTRRVIPAPDSSIRGQASAGIHFAAVNMSVRAHRLHLKPGTWFTPRLPRLDDFVASGIEHTQW
jgi:hypothetical protein